MKEFKEMTCLWSFAMWLSCLLLDERFVGRNRHASTFLMSHPRYRSSKRLSGDRLKINSNGRRKKVKPRCTRDVATVLMATKAMVTATMR